MSTQKIRPADPSDINAAVHLLRMRDQQEHPTAAVADYLFNFDADRMLAWLAYLDDQPVGINTLYLRRVRWCGETIRAGYWAHLFVDPQFRKLMIYPQLVAAMIRGAREAGLDVIYTGTRRAQVAEAHTKIGFTQVGVLTVLFKPLRPARLVAKHKGLGRAVEAVTSPLDALYLGYLSLRRPTCPQTFDVEAFDADSLDAESPVIHDVSQMFDDPALRSVSQEWTPEYFHRRFSTTIEGRPYTILTAHASGRLTAAVVYRVAERGDRRIRAGVIMNILGAEESPAAAAGLLAEAERRVVRAGGEVMLWLDGASTELSELLATLGYRKSPETYYILVWPKDRAVADSPAADLANWRFTFADHDAF